MLNTVEGIYRNGKIELAETPTEITEAHVLVTFLTSGKPATRQPRQPGTAKGRLTINVEDDEHLKDFQEYMPS